MSARIAQALGDRLLEHRRFHRLRETAVDEVDQVAVVDGHDQVGRRVLALRLDALGDAALDEDGIDGDPRLGGERVEERLDQAWLARRVDVDLAGLGERRRAAYGKRGNGIGGKAAAAGMHTFLQAKGFKAQGETIAADYRKPTFHVN